MARTSANDASLLFACEPLLIALMAFLFLRERLRRVQWAGLLLGLVGIRLIAGGGIGQLDRPARPGLRVQYQRDRQAI